MLLLFDITSKISKLVKVISVKKKHVMSRVLFVACLIITFSKT